MWRRRIWRGPRASPTTISTSSRVAWISGLGSVTTISLSSATPCPHSSCAIPCLRSSSTIPLLLLLPLPLPLPIPLPIPSPVPLPIGGSPVQVTTLSSYFSLPRLIIIISFLKTRGKKKKKEL